jgi:hypothetical protein
MMQVTYEGPLSGVLLEGMEVKRGEEVEVSEEIGKALIAQNPSSWSVVKKAKAKRED